MKATIRRFVQTFHTWIIFLLCPLTLSHNSVHYILKRIVDPQRDVCVVQSVTPSVNFVPDNCCAKKCVFFLKNTRLFTVYLCWKIRVLTHLGLVTRNGHIIGCYLFGFIKSHITSPAMSQTDAGIQISLNFVVTGPVQNKSALAQVMAWCRSEGKSYRCVISPTVLIRCNKSVVKRHRIKMQSYLRISPRYHNLWSQSYPALVWPELLIIDAW